MLDIIEANIPKNPKKLPVEMFDSVFQIILLESDA